MLKLPPAVRSALLCSVAGGIFSALLTLGVVQLVKNQEAKRKIQQEVKAHFTPVSADGHSNRVVEELMAESERANQLRITMWLMMRTYPGVKVTNWNYPDQQRWYWLERQLQHRLDRVNQLSSHLSSWVLTNHPAPLSGSVRINVSLPGQQPRVLLWNIKLQASIGPLTQAGMLFGLRSAILMWEKYQPPIPAPKRTTPPSVPQTTAFLVGSGLT